MAALILPGRRVVQPQGLVEIDNRHGLRPIGLYVPSYGRLDAGNGKPFLGGSALTVRAGAAGLSAIQTATNTGLYRAVPDFTPSAEITAIWHGVPLGTPAGSTPSLVSLANSTTSQSQSVFGLEYISSTVITARFKSGSVVSSRDAAFTWADALGKTVTFVASYSVDEALVRVDVCVNGAASTRLVESIVSLPMLATALGTEQFTVGPDVVEQPSRHINSQVALAGVFYGRLREGALADTLQNPWQLFKPIERRIWVAAAGSPPAPTWEDIPGATGSSYTTPPTTADMTGWQYRAVATNSAGSATSSAALLTVGAGAVDATAPGVTLSAAASLIAGAATGQIAASAAGVVLPAAASLLAGAATGQRNASAVGVDLAAAAALLPGAATGQQAASAAGATVAAAASFIAGLASGEAGATAPGASLSAAAALLAGAATGQRNASAPGATLSPVAALLPGLATGQQAASAAGATLTAAASFLPGAASGAAAGSAAGATVAATAALLPGTATGQRAASAAGVVLAAPVVLLAGSAVGGQGQAAAGATVAATASLIAGAAIGNGAAVAGGAVWLATVGLLPGAALGNVDLGPEPDRRSGSVGGLASGPDALLSRADYLRRFGRQTPAAATALQSAQVPARRPRAQRRREEEALLLG